jgi:hypothetical protein
VRRHQIELRAVLTVEADQKRIAFERVEAAAATEHDEAHAVAVGRHGAGFGRRRQ